MANFKKVVQYDANGNIRAFITTLEQVIDPNTQNKLSDILSSLLEDNKNLQTLLNTLTTRVEDLEYINNISIIDDILTYNAGILSGDVLSINKGRIEDDILYI